MSPDAGDRASLDDYLRALAAAGGDVTLESFRERAVQQARRTEAIVRCAVFVLGTLFITILAAVLVAAAQFNQLAWMVSWTICLGGLGAVASILLHILKLGPQEISPAPDEMVVIGRVLLGCLFSLVLSLALVPQALSSFYQFVGGKAAAPDTDVRLLLPFLCGYSIPLVLGLIDKAIVAIEITLGLSEPRPPRRGRVRRVSTN